MLLQLILLAVVVSIFVIGYNVRKLTKRVQDLEGSTGKVK